MPYSIIEMFISGLCILSTQCIYYKKCTKVCKKYLKNL